MPKIINEPQYIQRKEVKAVLMLFEGEKKLQYKEIRNELLPARGETSPIKLQPIKHEVELVRILKRLVKFGVLFKSKGKRDSFYKINPRKFGGPTATKRRFLSVKKDKKGIEKEILDIREQNMALILENARLKERLAQYGELWVVGPD